MLAKLDQRAISGAAMAAAMGVCDAVASVVHGSDAAVAAVGRRRSGSEWEGAGGDGLVPASVRLLLRVATCHRRMLLRAARTTAGRPQRQKLSPHVEPVLLRQLWSAIHSKRQLFGQTVQSVTSFFQAVDSEGKGSVGIADLRRAMQRLDVGLSSAQITRLLASIDADQSGAISKAELIGWMKRGMNSSATPDGRHAAADPDLGTGVALRLRWYAVSEDNEVTDLLTGDRGLHLRTRPDHPSAVDCDGLSFVEPRNLAELAELDSLRQSVAATLPRTSHIFVTVNARLEGVRGGQCETGKLTLASLADLPSEPISSRALPPWVRVLIQGGTSEGQHMAPRSLSKDSLIITVSGHTPTVTSLSEGILQLAAKLHSATPPSSGNADSKPNRASANGQPPVRDNNFCSRDHFGKRSKQSARARDGNNDNEASLENNASCANVKPADSRQTQRRTPLSDLDSMSLSNRDRQAGVQPLGARRPKSAPRGSVRHGAELRPKSAPRESNRRSTDAVVHSVHLATKGHSHASATVEGRRELAQALLDQQFSNDRDPDKHYSGNNRTAASHAGDNIAVTEAVARATRADAEVANLKKGLAAALKRCADSERAHSAVDGSLQRVYGQLEEVGRERSALQSQLRRLNNRYVSLATSHARLQATRGQSAPSDEGADPPAERNDDNDDNRGGGGKAAGASNLTMATRSVANRHARQHILHADSTATKTKAAGTARKFVAAGTSVKAGENDGHSVMSVAELRLCQQRLAQANRTIENLKAQVSQQSASQSAMALSLEEMKLENDALRQALAAAKQNERDIPVSPVPQPQPHPPHPHPPQPSRNREISRRPVDGARGTGRGKLERRQAQGQGLEEITAVAIHPLPEHVEQLSYHLDDDDSADKMSRLARDEVATEIDMEMRECDS